MAARGSDIPLALVVVLMMWYGAWAQQQCSNVIMSLSPCLNFVTGNATKPSTSCCSSLTGLVQTQPQCLCTLINGGGPMAGFAVNQTLAMALPAACNMQSPPVSQCNVASAPASSATSPAIAPSSDSTPSNSSSNDTPATAKTPSTQTNTPSSTGTGSKSTPTATGASSTNSPLSVAMFLSLVISFTLRASKF